MNPEHIHLALNHLPVLGATLALIPLLVGLLAHSKPALLSGLIMAAISCWITLPVMESGEEAHSRYMEGPVAPYLDAGAHEVIEEHEHRAEIGAKILVFNAVISTMGIVLVLLKKRDAEIICWVAVLTSVASLAVGIWIADSGGKIRRPDFRAHAVSSGHNGLEHHDDDD